MSKTPSIAVVIPSSGRPGAIERTLAALDAMSPQVPDEAVWIVDDHHAGELEHRLPPGRRWRVVRGPCRGPAAARNVGARQAASDWLIFLDDDCSPEPAWLTAYETAMREHPGAVLVGPVENGRPSNPWAAAYHAIAGYLFQRHVAARELSRHPFFAAANFAIPRAAFMALGGFDEAFHMASEDRDFSRRWLAEGGTTVAVPGAMVEHFHPPASFAEFVGQQFQYGRGAFDLWRQVQGREEQRGAGESVAFYLGLLRYAWGQPQGGVTCLAVLSAQFALAIGIAYQALLSPARRA